MARQIIVDRQDGLGERLRALMSGLYLSNITDSEFRFTWELRKQGMDAFHAIVPANEFFGPSFVSRVIENVPDGVPNFERTSNISDLKSCDVWAFRNVTLERALTQELKRSYADDISKCFDQIEFSAPISESIRTAHEVPLPENTVCLHLRAGDIIYGIYRTNARYFNKVVPLQIARKLIAEFKANGQQVLLLGQDAPTIEKLASEFGAVTTSCPDEYTEVQKAMFDIILMSRCEVVGGLSGFALVAAMIGNKSFRTPEEVLGPLENLDVRSLSEELSRSESLYPAMQISFGWWNLYKSIPQLSDEVRLEALENAQRLDASNFLYALELVEVNSNLNRLESVEALLKYNVESEYLANPTYPGLPSIQTFLTRNPDRTQQHLDKFQLLKSLSDANDVDYPYIHFFAAVGQVAEKRKRSALSCINRALRISPANTLFERLKIALEGG